MGFFDSIKNALGGKEPATEKVKGPSMALKEAGIDPSSLDFRFGGDGTVTITGEVADAGTRDRITAVVEAIPQVSAVDNQVRIAPAAAPEPTPEPAPDPAPEAPPAAEATPNPSDTGTGPVTAAPEPPVENPAAADRTYTVQPGDSLWKIAEAHYGNGSKYQAIFEANRDILDNPDLIKPGQVLKLPEV